MARSAATYRGARRLAAKKCLVLNEWSKDNPLRPYPGQNGVLVRPLPKIMRHAVAAGIIQEKQA